VGAAEKPRSELGSWCRVGTEIDADPLGACVVAYWPRSPLKLTSIGVAAGHALIAVNARMLASWSQGVTMDTKILGTSEAGYRNGLTDQGQSHCRALHIALHAMALH